MSSKGIKRSEDEDFFSSIFSVGSKTLFSASFLYSRRFGVGEGAHKYVKLNGKSVFIARFHYTKERLRMKRKQNLYLKIVVRRGGGWFPKTVSGMRSTDDAFDDPEGFFFLRNKIGLD